jgi:UDP:flavonoid glycosyltransferase YjiC (YdhE family)
MSNKKLTIFFAPLDAHGHVNACLGIAQVLQSRGHHIIFALDRSFKGKLTPLGIQEEIYVTKMPGVDEDEEFWPNYIAKYKMTFKGGPSYKLEYFSTKANETMAETIKAREDQYKEMIERIKPDLIVIDNYFCSPAQINSGIPWIWLVSASPLMAFDDPRAPPGQLTIINYKLIQFLQLFVNFRWFWSSNNRFI